MTDDEVRQVVVHPAAWEWLVDLLAQRGFTLARMPDVPELAGDLPTYIMVPTELRDGYGL